MSCNIQYIYIKKISSLIFLHSITLNLDSLFLTVFKTSIFYSSYLVYYWYFQRCVSTFEKLYHEKYEPKSKKKNNSKNLWSFNFKKSFNLDRFSTKKCYPFNFFSYLVQFFSCQLYCLHLQAFCVDKLLKKITQWTNIAD